MLRSKAWADQPKPGFRHANPQLSMQIVVASCDPGLIPYQRDYLALKLDRLSGNKLSQQISLSTLHYLSQIECMIETIELPLIVTFEFVICHP